MKVIKRSGDIVPFDKERILRAILKAAVAVNRKLSKQEADAVLDIVIQKIKEKTGYKNGRTRVQLEDIQDIVELTLMENRYFDIAKAYILYRQERYRTRETKSVMVDVFDTVQDYMERTDWRVNANANQDYSVGGLILNSSGKITANYWLNYVYPPEVKRAHIEGDFHIHDLDMLAGYCSGWSLKQLLYEGFNGPSGNTDSNPPRHLGSAVSQIINFFGTLQNEWAGAMAFSSFDTYLAPYIRIDNLNYDDVQQVLQQFVFNCNVPSRWGTQTPFTNITFDWVCPVDMKDQPVIIAGELQDFTYGDCQAEMDMINKAFLEIMQAGDARGRVFTFPIPTYNLTPDFDWEGENVELLFKMTAKYGAPYFQNYICTQLNPGDVRSMCCRLQLDLKELKSRGNGLFGSAEMTGSIGVVTINLARLGYLASDKQEFFEKLARLMDIARNSLEIKRKLLQKNLDNGFYIYTRRYLPSLRNHFSTIGLNGANEASLNLIGADIASLEGREFAKEILNFMRNRISQYQEETGNLYNLEATPAEGATFRFAKEDRARFPGIIQANQHGDPYYTNSTQLPVNYTDDPIAALRHQEEIQPLYNGGTVFHLYLGEQIRDWQGCRNLVRKIAENVKIPYFTITPTFSICPNHGYLSGEVPSCPTCETETEVWSRVMGYFRPVNQWNKGKRSEFKDRKVFLVQNQYGDRRVPEAIG
ncbi:MAG: ribonucleoside triphosphate reductase [Vulcanimicrobiota bacterium]